MADQAWYLGCRPSDVAERAVLVGDRGRVSLAAELLDGPRWLNDERGLSTVTGMYAGCPVTVCAFGMGGPAAAVVVHELAMLGVRAIVRLGTVVCLPPARPGDLVVVEGAVRGEATSATYLPREYPAVPDVGLLTALLLAVAETSGAGHGVVGLVASYDGFYTELFPADGAGPAPGRTVDDLRRVGVLGADMETSTVLVAGRALGLAAAALCLATVDAVSRERLASVERRLGERHLLHAGLVALSRQDVTAGRARRAGGPARRG